MKKGFSLLLALALLVGCSACSDDNSHGLSKSDPWVVEDFSFYDGEGSLIHEAKNSMGFLDDPTEKKDTPLYTYRGIKIGDSVDKLLEKYDFSIVLDCGLGKGVGDNEALSAEDTEVAKSFNEKHLGFMEAIQEFKKIDSSRLVLELLLHFYIDDNGELIACDSSKYNMSYPKHDRYQMIVTIQENKIKQIFVAATAQKNT